jgi:dTDP-4-dehydrorhamnose reductase
VAGLIDSDASGLLHACNPGAPVSWHGLATAVVKEMKACGVIAECPEIAGQKLAEMQAFRALRPRFTAMDTRRLSAVLGQAIRPWPAALKQYVWQRCRPPGDG